MVYYIYMEIFHQAMVEHALNPTLKKQNQADLHEFNAIWSTELIQGKLELLQRETLSWEKKKVEISPGKKY